MHRVALHFRRVKYNVFLIHKILSKLGHQRCYIMTINIKIKLTDVFSGANTRTLNINHIYSDKIFKLLINLQIVALNSVKSNRCQTIVLINDNSKVP